jgi:(1->4)-alpha-D-glucan 1-alpha-D-glucosylmutase
MVYNPLSTYRIQFSKEFTFSDFEKIIPFLHKLGIATIYASPAFGAVPGSEHGYDVTNPFVINPEIGTKEQFLDIHKRLKKSGIGWVQDIVPNHMAFSIHNPWIEDILENGQQSAYSDFFDIDWNHPDKRLNGKLMLPFFGAGLDELISNDEISLSWNGNRFVLKYFENEYPLNFKSYLILLDAYNKSELPDEINKSIMLFEKAGQDKNSGQQGKKMLAEQYVADEKVSGYVDKILRRFNKSKKLLKNIIQLQFYVPVHWKQSESVLNYRRFFTINDMICLKIEKQRIFDIYHAFIKELCRKGIFQGLRVDHIDGMYNPCEYLQRLRELAGKDVYIIVEKILEKDEQLEKDWPVQGNTGYDFLSSVNNLLTNEKNRHLIAKTYFKWSDKEEKNFNEVLYQKKHFILYNRMAGDLDNLYRHFLTLKIIRPKFYNDKKLKAAIGEFLLHCQVYKIYEGPGNFSGQQEKQVNDIFDRAVEKTPQHKDELELLRSVFLLRKDEFTDKTKQIHDFFRRCMQFTGPLMAKGGEDTAFYTYNRFISHSEVGDSPSYFGISAKEFHQDMLARQKDFPLTLNALSTHDTKRGEDARARLAVISDIPSLWENQIKQWHTMNDKHKVIDNNHKIPNPNDEYFIYQAIIGSLPVKDMSSEDFEARLKNYITKVLREGKEQSNWTEPEETYEKATHQFIHSILSDTEGFLKQTEPFLHKVAYLGVINSLTQTLLKFTAPGIPDTYQGSEAWNFSFVDPDNRRPVDFKKLEGELDSLVKSGVKLSALWPNPFESKIKLLLTHLLLKFREKNSEIFEKGDYIPLEIRGELKHMVLAFAHRLHEKTIITVIPLHPGSCFDNDTPVNPDNIDWKDTIVSIPEDRPALFENILDGKQFQIQNSIALAELFEHIPFGLLKSH